MFGLGALELTIFAVILVLFFGPKKIPEIAQGIGDTIRYIRKGFSDGKNTDTTNKTN